MDTEGRHEHGHAPHRTGYRWLDISLALSAFFVSFVSLGVAIHQVVWTHTGYLITPWLTA